MKYLIYFLVVIATVDSYANDSTSTSGKIHKGKYGILPGIDFTRTSDTENNYSRSSLTLGPEVLFFVRDDFGLMVSPVVQLFYEDAKYDRYNIALNAGCRKYFSRWGYLPNPFLSCSGLYGYTRKINSSNWSRLFIAATSIGTDYFINDFVAIEPFAKVAYRRNSIELSQSTELLVVSVGLTAIFFFN